MDVLSIEHAEERIRGYLCRHMYQIRPGVYVGRLSAARRKQIWEHICKEQPEIDAVLCSDAARGRIEFLVNGDPTRSVTLLDGIPMLTFHRTPMSPWQLALGKKSIDQNTGKRLWEHMLDTGVFAYEFLTESSFSSVVSLLHSCIGDDISEKQLLSTLCYLISMHDIGKISPYFQYKMGADENVLCSSSVQENVEFRHEKYSRELMRDILKNCGFEKRRTRTVICDVIGDHHQNKPENDMSYPCDTDKDMLDKMIHSLSDLMRKEFQVFPFCIKKDENLFAYLFSGILRLSDWSASDYAERIFSMEGEDLDSYIERSRREADRYIASGGLQKWEPDLFYTWDDFFGGKTVKLRPLQKKIEDVLESDIRKECIVIEAEPGSGKTEAGFYLAMNLLKEANKEGIYYALPTAATAEAVLSRIQKIKDLTKAFPFSDLQLYTGTAWMTWIKDGSEDDLENRLPWSAYGPRKLLSSIACGTVDQIMAAVEQLKAGDMRLLGLSNKILIIDEFHAYDAYMMKQIWVLLEMCRSMKIPVIILSATLQKETLRDLSKIYQAESETTDAYPLITVYGNKESEKFPCKSTFKKKYDVEHIDRKDACDKILYSIKNGGNTLYIANTVQHVYSLYSEIKDRVSTDTLIMLYTARTTLKNKEEMGKKITFLYGKTGKEEGKRPEKSIVIATQIIEMSMDVDFDTLFTEIAPSDSILQRLGRLRRHDDIGTVREHGFSCVCYIVYMEHNKYWALPYSEAVVAGTEDIIRKFEQIRVPDDVRPLIEQSYEKAGDKWKSEQYTLAAHADPIEGPNRSYCVRTNLRSVPQTRYSADLQVKILCVTEEDIKRLNEAIQTREQIEIAAKLIYTQAVTIPQGMLDHVEKLETQDTKIKYLRDYIFVKDKKEYWGKDGIFIGG